VSELTSYEVILTFIGTDNITETLYLKIGI
jgi:hypothetical protein